MNEGLDGKCLLIQLFTASYSRYFGCNWCYGAMVLRCRLWCTRDRKVSDIVSHLGITEVEPAYLIAGHCQNIHQLPFCELKLLNSEIHDSVCHPELIIVLVWLTPGRQVCAVTCAPMHSAASLPHRMTLGVMEHWILKAKEIMPSGGQAVACHLEVLQGPGRCRLLQERASLSLAGVLAERAGSWAPFSGALLSAALRWKLSICSDLVFDNKRDE